MLPHIASACPSVPAVLQPNQKLIAHTFRYCIEYSGKTTVVVSYLGSIFLNKSCVTSHALLRYRREQGTPLMQAAAGKSAQTYRAVMDAIRSRLGVETLVSHRRHKSKERSVVACDEYDDPLGNCVQLFPLQLPPRT